MKKRLLSLFMVLALIFGFIPFKEIKSYAQESNEVRVRVEGRDKTLYDRKVTVTEAVYCDDYLKIIDNNIKLNDSGITTLFGETVDYSTDGTWWMNYFVKNENIDSSKSVSQYKLNDADEIVLSVANMSTLIPVIDIEKDGEKVKLAVNGKSWSGSSPYSGADLKISYIGNKTTNSNGESNFELNGIHKVEIGDYPDLVRKTIYVGETDVVEEVKSRIDSFKNYFNNNTEKFTYDVAPAYYAVSESEEEIQNIKQNYEYELEQDASFGKCAKHVIALLAKDVDSSTINKYAAILLNSLKDNGGFYEENTWIGNKVFTILALDLVKDRYPDLVKDQDYNVNKAIDSILKHKKSDGSFSDEGDIDSVSMALVALANHRDIQGVNDAINSSLEYIKKNQLDTGGFEAWGAESPSTIAWVIKGLVAIDINPLSIHPLNDDGTTKNENTMLDALINFKQSDILNDNFSRNDVFSGLVDLYNGESMYKNLNPHVHEDYKINTGSDIEEPEYNFELTRNKTSNFEKGTEAQFNVKVKNNKDTNEKVTYIVALYKLHEDNKELYTYTFVTKTINAGSTEEFAGGFLIPASGEYEVKGMLWDNFDDKTPLAKEIKVDVD